MRLSLLVLVVASVMLSASCSDGVAVSPAPVGGRAIDLGGGVVASIGRDGSLAVTRCAELVVASAAGVPLFSRLADPAAPDAWHDPTVAAPLAGIDPATIGAEAKAPGVLHLSLPMQPPDTALVSFALAADDGFYGGLGERFDHADARGRVVPMHLALQPRLESGTNEAHVPVPFFVSSRGYGVFVASREAGAFDVAATDARVARATFEGRALDVYVLVDPDPLAIVAAFAKMTGLPRPLPTWALAPMHWRDTWNDASQVLGDARELRRRHIPASTLWFDNPWQTGYNTFRFDPSRFGDPTPMLAELKALGFHTLCWSTPYLEAPSGATPDEAQQLFAQADASGWFVKDASGRSFVSPAAPVHGGAGVIDFTSDGARSFWQSLAARATALDVRGFKIDYGEDLVPVFLGQRLGVHLADGSTERTARAYPIAMHSAYHAALTDGFLLVRASGYGGAAQADVVWPGDLDNGFERQGDVMGDTRAVGGLPAAVVAAQTLAASGFPAFGSDTGGFRHGMPTREALLRWAEHTALSIILQLGGGGDSHNPWAYDEEASSIYAGLAGLHMQLVPYLEVLMAAAAAAGTPTIRSLPLAFPSDAGSRAHADDEYLLGPDLLVAPVLDAGATSRAVHVPPGRWIGWWDGAIADGPADVTVSAPLGAPPLFARAGALLPMLPAGIDTLVDAADPSVVTLTTDAALGAARAWVAGAASAAFDDGARIAIDDAPDATHLTWRPGIRSMLTIDLDLRSRRGGGGGRVGDVVAVSGPAPTNVAIDVANARVKLTMTGGGELTIH